MEQVETPVRRMAVKVAVVETTAPAPTHLFGWLPIVWTRVLFPGAAPPTEPCCWPAVVLLFVMSGLLLYPCMSFHLFEPDEGRYAQIPREMLDAGEWIVPTLQGEAYLDKPPLFYWLVMLSYTLFGYHDWAARLVPVLAMHVTVLVTYLLGRRVVGERPAFWGSLLLTVSPYFLGVGRLLVFDGLLTLWVTLALLAMYLSQSLERKRSEVTEIFAYASGSEIMWLLAAAACGLGVLTKGPVALLLVLAPFALQRLLVRDRVAISWRAWGVFGSVVLAISLPWYVAVCVVRPEFARYFFWQHNVERFIDPFDHARPLWFYVPIVAFGLLPGVLLAWPIGRFLFSARPDDAARRCVGLGYVLLAGIGCVAFFSLAGSKLPTYILPAFPPLCLALGCFVTRTGWDRSRWMIGFVAACWLVLACSHYLVIPAIAWQRSPMNCPDEVHAWCADSSVPVVCFPRNVDSAAFYLGRADFRTYRSKEIDELVRALASRPRTIVLFAHRNSPETLARHLPGRVRITARRKLGLCEMAVVERK